MAERHTFKFWKRRCDCGFTGEVPGWTYEMPLRCPTCGAPTQENEDRPNQAHGIIPDDIPGGMEIRHGLVNKDGSPRKFYSKSEIRAEARRRGWTISGETPKLPENREF